MSECPHGLDTDWCSICKHGPEKKEKAHVVAAFYAKYDGHCPECNLPIMVGQYIVKLSDDRVCHDECVERFL